MRETIERKLQEIETNENVRILMAVEAGSRACGLASPTSDYDVRFIYVRNPVDYLKLETQRDVIELAFEGDLDINGWDLQKALRLLYKSNPTLFEWFSSPIVYRKTDFVEKLRSFMPEYFSMKRGLYHYLSMAKGNFREYLKQDRVRAKKYFYVLRPILACYWILEKKASPPVLFSELIEAQLPENLREIVDGLLDLKINSPEVKEIARVDVLNAYLESSIIDLEQQIKVMPEDVPVDWRRLDEMFLREIGMIPTDF